MTGREKEKVRKALGEEWYVQGVSAIPIFIVFCGLSAYKMKDRLGFGYTQNLLNFRRGYGEMSYWWPDLRRMWGIIKGKQDESNQYLFGIKKEHEGIVRKNEDYLSGLSDERIKGLNYVKEGRI